MRPWEETEERARCADGGAGGALELATGIGAGAAPAAAGLGGLDKTLSQLPVTEQSHW